MMILWDVPIVVSLTSWISQKYVSTINFSTKSAHHERPNGIPALRFPTTSLYLIYMHIRVLVIYLRMLLYLLYNTCESCAVE